MGRKSIDRTRKPLSKKAELWVRELIPLLQDKDLNQLTLDELAALVGKSKSTIYTYFATKEEIYQTVTQLVLEDLMKDLLADDLLAMDSEKGLRTLLLKISAGIEGVSIHFLEQVQNHFPSIWNSIEQFTQYVLTTLAEIYAKGMEHGVFQRFNITLLTALDRHFVLSIMTNNTLFCADGLTLKDLVKEYLELRLSALLIK